MGCYLSGIFRGGMSYMYIRHVTSYSVSLKPAYIYKKRLFQYIVRVNYFQVTTEYMGAWVGGQGVLPWAVLELGHSRYCAKHLNWLRKGVRYVSPTPELSTENICKLGGRA